MALASGTTYIVINAFFLYMWIVILYYPHQQERRRVQECSGITKDKKVSGRDNVLVAQLNNIGSKAHRWMLAMLKKLFMENKIPTIWRESIGKTGQYCNSKELPPISLVCQTYKLYESMILNIIATTIELHQIKEQAAFRPGKSFTSQLLNITKHIQGGYQESMIIGTIFVDLSSAKDTVNQRLLIM